MKNCTIVNCAKVFPFVSSDSIHYNATSGKGKQGGSSIIQLQVLRLDKS